MSAPPILFHLKVVARICLALGAAAAAVLLAVLNAAIGGGSGESYGDIIRMHSLTHAHLGKAMLVAGLLLVAVTALMTALIGYYSSYRVAGPLYRFGQNLRLAAGDQHAPLAGLRRGDALGEQAAAIDGAVARLRHHHEALGAAAADAAQACAAGDSVRYGAALARLNELDALARL